MCHLLLTSGFMTHPSSVTWPLSALTSLYLREETASCLKMNGVLEDVLSCTGQKPKHVAQHCHCQHVRWFSVFRATVIDYIYIIYLTCC